ncbi:hypothetical protein V5F77_09350 [Xanthobacter sp. DSM 24535]|uniref:hypothetical protein n=1 Tax=Roseixanthobacter psychrophilus TaxID=3119917 RepID=UPI00372C7C5D
MTISASRPPSASRGAPSWRDWALFAMAYGVILALLLGAPLGLQRRADAVAPQTAMQSASTR